MTAITRQTRVLNGIEPGDIPYNDLIAQQEPVIVKGAVRDWPLVIRGTQSAKAAMDYLLSYDTGIPMVAYEGQPEIGGRFFYDDDLRGLNFKSERVLLADFLNRIEASIGETDAPSLYIGSGDVDTALAGLRNANDLALDRQLIAPYHPVASIWIGNKTVAATHYDMSNNLACCMVGRRRFTLFPPDQIANLYPGPLEPTPGGQVVSMADPRAPDLTTYPRFADALAAAQTADLEPGDVLFYPALWWHQVEALDSFNVMMNYWWNPVPSFMDTPMNTLLHGILSLRDRPESEKRAWQHMFDYYLFGSADMPAAHLPPHARGPLDMLEPLAARRLRALLLQRFNR